MPDLPPDATLPPAATAASIAALIGGQGFALVPAEQLRNALAIDTAALDALRPSWERLPRDTYLLDAGRYRSRRHGSLVHRPASGSLEQVSHRAHWQSENYNALHGGMERWFEPIEDAVAAAPAWRNLIARLGELFARLRPVERWHVEAHQFRIDTSGGIGRPTPEGAHRDGVDYVAVILVDRREVRGGETRVFSAEGSEGLRFTMEESWTTLLLDDARVIHETTPILPAESAGVRDTIVLTYREDGFQSAPG